VWGRSWGSLPGGGGDGYSVAYDASDAVASCATSCSRSLLYYHRGWFNNLNVTSSRITGSQNVAAALPVWSDPFRPGVLLAVIAGQLYISYGNDGRQQAAWACIDPTPTVAQDSVRVVVPSRSALPPAAGTYAVAVNGPAGAKVYIVTLAGQPPGSTTPSCSSPAGTATEIFPAAITGTGVTWVQGLSEDPTQPCRFHIAASSFLQQWRAIVLSNVENGCTQTYSAAPLAGLATDVFPVPATLTARSILADPAQPATIYLGTDAGLYIGATGGPSVDWRRAVDFPTSRVDTLDVQRNTSGVPRFVFASTFGRGVWQRFLSDTTPPPSAEGVLDTTSGSTWPSATPASVAHLSVATCRAWMVSGDPAGPGEQAWVDVHLTNSDPPFPVDLRATPTRHGEIQPYFGRERVQLPAGGSTVRLMVSYDSADGPLRLQTDGIALEFLGPGDELVTRIDCDSQTTWQRHDAALLRVDAVLHQREAGLSSEHAVIKIARSGHPSIERTTPFELGYPAGETVQLSVLEPVAEGEFRGWLVDGHPRHADSIEVVLNGDRAATLMYAEVGP
jgi:hypothetical protein